jgi:hypothetical protein
MLSGAWEDAPGQRVGNGLRPLVVGGQPRSIVAQPVTMTY